MSTTESFHKGVAFQTYSVGSTSATSITTVDANGNNATKIRVTVLGADIRYRYDGGAPTSNLGHFIGNGLSFELFGPTSVQQFQAISTLGTATLSITLEIPEPE